MRRFLCLNILVIFLPVLLACNAEQVAGSGTLSVSTPVIASPLSMPTHTPFSVASPIPTATPNPTPTNSPTPAATATAVTLTVTETPVPSPVLITPPPTLEELRTQSKLSPDGQWIALSKFEQPPGEQDYHILFQVARIDGSVSWTLVDEWSRGLGYTYPWLLSWSENSQHFYFTEVQVPDGCGSPFKRNSEIRRVDVRDGQVTDVPVPAGYEHTISPDETTIAYISLEEPLQLVIHNIQNATEQKVLLPIQASEAGKAEAGNIVWSPDGIALVLIIANGPLCQEVTPTFSVMRIDVATLTPTILVSSDHRLLRVQEWSNDGRILLKDWDNYSWWIDATTGELVSAPVTPTP